MDAAAADAAEAEAAATMGQGFAAWDKGGLVKKPKSKAKPKPKVKRKPKRKGLATKK